MKDNIYIRIILFFVVWFLLPILPWWITLVGLLFFTVYFTLYLEIIFFGFVFDILYFSQGDFSHYGLLSGASIFLLILFIRSNIRS